MGLQRARQILFQADQTAIVNFFLLVLTYSRDLGSYGLIYDPPLQLEVVPIHTLGYELLSRRHLGFRITFVLLIKEEKQLRNKY